MDSVFLLTKLSAFVSVLADLAHMRRRKQSLLYLCSLFTLFVSPRVLVKLANQRIILSLRMMDLFKARNKLLTRIYISMLALLMAAFFFIGVFTYYNFKTQNQSYHEKRLLRKETATLSSISYFLKNINAVSPDDKGVFTLFEQKIFELADIHNLDIIIYSLQGDLVLSSNKLLVKKQIIPDKINATLLKKLSEKKGGIKKNLTHTDMNYLNSYQYILDKNQAPIAIISIPYFQLNESYKRDLRVYLLALVPVYLFLFLGANLLALILSRQITGPMSRLSETMREAAIMKRFMPLSWSSKDEIGQLVRQYNFMVKELEKSAEILAQNEKESAWKEMAKQVAHEIKNPLTPMKLNVQLFERTLKTEDPLTKDKVKIFSDSIIEQIDTLSDIASSFSDFAKMPMSKKEKIDLSKIAENSINFFNATNIVFDKPTESCCVYADRGQVIRILNNLLNNAIESVPENKTPLITVSIKLINDCVNLSVGDNGEGIPTALHKKIFNPSFTTKNSGMGLGLAIVKRIINDLNGSISFKSNLGQGTTFYIGIPHLKEKTNFTD